MYWLLLKHRLRLYSNQPTHSYVMALLLPSFARVPG